MNLQNIQAGIDLRSYILDLLDKKEEENRLFRKKYRSRLILKRIEWFFIQLPKRILLFLLEFFYLIKEERVQDRYFYPDGVFPSLLDYLLSVWAVLDKHKKAQKMTYKLMVEILEEAFKVEPKKVDWNLLLTHPNLKEPKDVHSYEFFETFLRNFIVDLRLWETHKNKHKICFENYSVSAFLERGTDHLESSFYSSEQPLDWYDLYSIFHDGRYME